MKKVKLGDVCKIQAGGTPSRANLSYWNGDIPWVKISDIKEKYLNKTEEFITHDGLNNSSAKIFEKGTILYTIFATLGEVSILEIEATTNQAIAGLQIVDKNVNQNYLYYYLVSLKSYVNEVGRGVAQNNINMQILRNFKIPLPSLEEQKAIAGKLDKVSGLIEKRKTQLEKLDLLIKSRFIEMFGNPMTNSNGYVLKKYGDLFELNAGGTPSKQKPEYWDNGTISWIGSNMCQNSVIYENDGNYISEEGLKHSSARMFPVDTVLIALVGATIGKTALLKFETTTNQNVLGVRGIKESGYTPEFIFHYTQGLYQKFLNIGDGGFAMASKGFISELPVPVVDLAIQEKFAAFVEQIDKSKFEIQKSLEKLEILKKSLMQQYFG